jgi:hypothetical protein
LLADIKLLEKIEQCTNSWLEILKAHEFWCENKSFASAVFRALEFVELYNERQLNLPNWY